MCVKIQTLTYSNGEIIQFVFNLILQIVYSLQIQKIWNTYIIYCFNREFLLFQGTSAEQDNRFSNKHKKLLKQLKFAECLEKKVENMEIHAIFFFTNVFITHCYHKPIAYCGSLDLQ